MFEYLIDGETVTIPRDKLEEVLSQNPEAEFVKEVKPGNQTPSPEETDVPAEENTATSDITESTSEDGSSDSMENQINIDPTDPDGDDKDEDETDDDELETKPLSRADADYEAYLLEQKGEAGFDVKEGIFVQPTPTDIAFQGRFSKGMEDLFKSEFPPDKIASMLSKNSMPSIYVRGSMNIKAQEDPEFAKELINIENLSKDFSTLPIKDRNYLIGVAIESTLTQQRNNPVADLYYKKANEILLEVGEKLKPAYEMLEQKANNAWLETEMGRRRQKMDQTVFEATGKEWDDLSDLDPSNMGDYTQIMSVYGNQMDKNRFINQWMEKEGIELNGIANKMFQEAIEEEPVLNEMLNMIGPAAVRLYNKMGIEQNRKDNNYPWWLGGGSLNPNPGPLQLSYEAGVKGGAVIEFGFIVLQSQKESI